VGSTPDEVIEFFNLPNSSSRPVALGSTQPLTQMSTRNLHGLKGQSMHMPDIDCPENVGASNSHNPTGLHGLLKG
jgi:hypothetical protein